MSYQQHAPARETWIENESATLYKHIQVETYRVTPWIFGTSPGSRMAYDTPLKVVPTSSAITRDLVVPLYGLRVSELGFIVWYHSDEIVI